MFKGTATVVKNAGSHFYLSELPVWAPFAAVLRGKVRLDAGNSTNPIAVGDRVEYSYETVPDETNPAIITGILPRTNHVIRKSTNLSRQSHVIAANVDMALLVCTLYFPEIKLPFLDRMTVSCEAFRIPATIVLNKVDLYADEAPEQVDEFIKTYTGAGYEVIRTSVKTGEGIDRIRDLCKGGVNLICGESGVGKSSIVKAIDPSLDPKIGKISISHLQGRHTTSLYEMYPLVSGGYMIDTPGLRGFGLYGVDKSEIYTYFPEMLRVADNCRYMPCSHTHEPGCAVKQALEKGEISQSRYDSYLGMLEDDNKFR